MSTSILDWISLFILGCSTKFAGTLDNIIILTEIEHSTMIIISGNEEANEGKHNNVSFCPKVFSSKVIFSLHLKLFAEIWHFQETLKIEGRIRCDMFYFHFCTVIIPLYQSFLGQRCCI